MKQLLVPITLLLSATMHGQLAPDTNAPLYDHLLEVNAQWANHTPARPATPVRFAQEKDRIAQHLHLVREHLATHAPAGLSAAQATERAALLEVLDTYADAGRFPQNHVLPYRNPIFIDPQGTACAVGQLMIASGHRTLAERIDAELETGYLAEILADARFQAPVSTWATDHGFTADELAWIQPAYPPVIPWVTLGGGTNNTVNEVLTLPDGDLLVVGTFTYAGGVACQGAARWNGSGYTAMGTLPDGVVTCAVVHEGVIHVGGSFNNGSIDLLHWTGTAWEGETVFASKWAEVTALHSHNGQLYAAGSESGFAGVDHGVKVKQSGNWSPLPGVLNGPIHALEFHEDFLIAGGEFTGAFLSTQNEIMHVARYMNAGWHQVADGLDGTVHDLMVHDGALYATGMMVAMTGPYFGLASIVADQGTWAPLMPNIMNYISTSPVDAPSVAYAMLVHGGRIYIVGDFHINTPMTYGRGVMAYNGAPDDVEPLCDFMGYGNSIALLGSDQLVVGGASEVLENIISTDLTSAIAEGPPTRTVAIHPNPAKDMVSITLPGTLPAGTRARLFDATGRAIAVRVERQAEQLRMDVSTLAPGAYTVEVYGEGIRATGRLVKR